MKHMLNSKLKNLVLLVFVFSIVFQTNLIASSGKGNVVLKAMEEELGRSMQILGKKGTPPPYFIGYRITENRRINISAAYGSLSSCSERHSRILDVDVRVGSHKLDNSHAIRGSYDFNFSIPVEISVEDDPDAIKSTIWLETDRRYKAAVEKLIKVKANLGVMVKEEDQSDDFSKEKPRVYAGETETVSTDTASWKKKLKEYSALFNSFPDIYSSRVTFSIEAKNKYFVNSEGSSLQHGYTFWRMDIFARTKAEDGMELYKFKTFDGRLLETLPDQKTIKTAVQQLANDLSALREAPLMVPFTGPAILTGPASGVFFHEIFGHRIEGHRQKDESDGQTFTRKLNEQILPTHISVTDDPTLKTYGDTDLNGHYLFDDEGVKAERVEVVKNGILKNFLMSRSPIDNFPRSNGHGRAQAGRAPVSRQGNLIIESTKSVPVEKLRQMLVEECKVQGKTYGLLFDDVVGGFTFTGRFIPQAFNVTPITVYRVYVDGRPDELVRGVDLIGTPLTSFSKIIACSDKFGVFNGTCGAESGGVPVSAVSPHVLTTQIEVQKKHKESEKPPVLPPPERREK